MLPLFIKIKRVIKIVFMILFIASATNMLWHMLVEFLGIYPPAQQLDPTMPSFEVKIEIAGEDFHGEDRKAVYCLQSGLIDIRTSSNIVAQIANRHDDPSFAEDFDYWALGKQIKLTVSEDNRLFIQIDTNKCPYSAEILEGIREELRDRWKRIVEASVSTSEGLQPYLITVLEDGDKEQRTD